MGKSGAGCSAPQLRLRYRRRDSQRTFLAFCFYPFGDPGTPDSHIGCRRYSFVRDRASGARGVYHRYRKCLQRQSGRASHHRQNENIEITLEYLEKLPETASPRAFYVCTMELTVALLSECRLAMRLCPSLRGRGARIKLAALLHWCDALALKRHALMACLF